MNITEQLIEHFYRYLSIPSQSSAGAGQIPSSPGQTRLAGQLEQELTSLGMVDIHRDEYSNVTARLPGNRPDAPKIGFVAHLDTVDVSLSDQINPQRITFTGEDICLNEALDIWFRVAEHPEIKSYHQQEIIFSDGTSVLGADNKAAIAVVMVMLDQIQRQQLPHGDIYIAFVPDEEIGLLGAKKLDLTRFAPDFAYTIDCCAQGEVVYETFNAGSAEITITGIPAHPMAAKGVMVNPVRVATDLINCFDAKDGPEHTDGKAGYFWFKDITANQNQAILKIDIRDFNLKTYQARKRYLEDAVIYIRKKYPKARIDCTLTDVYDNIANHLGTDRRSIDLIYQALAELDIPPHTLAMRGGTDGSALSARGLVTPNYFTGAHNFHSRFEFLPVESFLKSYEVTLKIIQLAGDLSDTRAH